MKKYVKIGLIVLTVGILMCVISGAIIYATEDNFNFGNFGPTTSFTETLDDINANPDDIKNISISLSMGDIKIESGSEFRLEADDVYEKSAAHLNLNGDTLEIKEKKKKKDPLNINFGVVTTQNYTLTIPDEVYENINFELAFCDAEVKDISCENAEFDISFGDFECTNLDVSDSFTSNTSFGDSDFEIVSDEIERISVNNSFGDYDLKAKYLTENGDIDNSFGDCTVTLRGDNYKISKSNSFGDISADSNRSGSDTVNVSADNSFGDLDIDTD